MKKYCILLFTMLIMNGASAQSCLPNGITFTMQSQIDSFQINYPNCTEIEGSLTISGDNITNLNGLSVITSIDGDFWITRHHSMTNLAGLEGLTTIGGSLVVCGEGIGWPTYYNHLSSLAGLENLTSIALNLEMRWTDSLSNLTGLDGLTSIGGYLEIGSLSFGGQNVALTSLTGLEYVTDIGGSLTLMNSPSLSSLAGLGNLTAIGGILTIAGNPSLTTLTGIDNINAGTIMNLSIAYNDSLSTCEVQSICDYLANPNGNIQIQNNATGCNSRQEVEIACAAIGVDDLKTEFALTIYPNPTSTIIIIETPTKGSLSILNFSGKELLHQAITEPNTTIDVSTMLSGIYLVKVVGNKDVYAGKFVKQ